MMGNLPVVYDDEDNEMEMFIFGFYY